MKLKRISMLNTEVSVTNLDSASLYIEDCINQRCQTYVCVAPVSTIVDAHENDEYRKIINHSGMTTPDGMPVVWLGRMKGERAIERTYGPDLMLKCCDLSQQKGYRHFFYGGTTQSNELMIANLGKKFPQLNIVGKITPPIRNIGEKEDQVVLEEINKANPDILWVGLGSPKQDYWMHNHRDKLKVPVMVGVGAAFDFLAGVKKQAPVWMRKMGLEWFFRLCCEPRRLWKRYIIGNTKFVYWVVKDFLKRNS